MKSRVISLLLIIIAINATLDPETVKSQGSFNNVAPDATKIVTPRYASPKVEVTLVNKDYGLATRDYQVGTITQPVETNVYNPVSQTMEKEVKAHDVKLSVTSTFMAPITNVSKTQIDVNTKKVVPYPNNLTAPKDYHGINEKK